MTWGYSPIFGKRALIRPILKRGVTRTIRQELRRRSAIEPEIGHMKNDGHLGGCYLKGHIGDAIDVLLVAAGHNLRKILARLRGIFVWLPELVRQAKLSPANLPECEIFRAA